MSKRAASYRFATCHPLRPTPGFGGLRQTTQVIVWDCQEKKWVSHGMTPIAFPSWRSASNYVRTIEGGELQPEPNKARHRVKP